MAILQMQKVRLLVHELSAAKTIKTIQEFGAVEFNELTDPQDLKTREKTVYSIDHAASRVELTVNFLKQYQTGSLLREALEQGRVSVSETEIEKIVHTFYYSDLVQKSLTLKENINNAEAKLKDLAEEKKILEQWINWDIPLSYDLITRKTETHFLTGKPEAIEAALEELDDHPCTTYQQTNDNALVLTFLHDDRAVIKRIITEHQLERVVLPTRRGTPAEELKRIERSANKTFKHLEKFHDQAKALTVHLPKLKIISDYLSWKKERFDMIHQAHGTQETLVFEGWVPKKLLPKLEKRLTQITDLVALESIPSSEVKETTPVEIQNHDLIKPFESVTRLYGLPNQQNLDPSPYLAGFFFVFFGICLSDVGYGLILTSMTMAVLYFYRLEESFASFIKLLMAGGISSLLAGLVFGGYFGIDPAHLPSILLSWQYFDPIANPLPIFYLALILGVIQIIFGMILSVVRELKNSNLSAGLISTTPWLAFFSALGWLVLENLDLAPNSNGLSLTLIYLTLIAIVISKAWQSEGNLFKKLLMGVLGLYNFVQYLSDTLSYSRLLALGLATSALAYSINLIAIVVWESVPYVGWLLMILVLVIGHLFNMVVNILSSFIHTARLQFVEFFGKFITDTGRPFRPFQRERKHTILKPASRSVPINDR